MKIDAITSYLYASQRTQAVAGTGSAEAVSTTQRTSAVNEVKDSDSSGVKTVDFTNMTRLEMRDWLNDQIRSGTMTLDESTPLMGISAKFVIEEGALKDLVPTDTERVNFFELMQGNVEGAQWRHDDASVRHWSDGLQTMRQKQGQAMGIDILV
jgi:hypothetical protein